MQPTHMKSYPTGTSKEAASDSAADGTGWGGQPCQQRPHLLVGCLGRLSAPGVEHRQVCVCEHGAWVRLAHSAAHS